MCAGSNDCISHGSREKALSLIPFPWAFVTLCSPDGDKLVISLSASSDTRDFKRFCSYWPYTCSENWYFWARGPHTQRWKVWHLTLPQFHPVPMASKGHTEVWDTRGRKYPLRRHSEPHHQPQPRKGRLCYGWSWEIIVERLITKNNLHWAYLRLDSFMNFIPLGLFNYKRCSASAME